MRNDQVAETTANYKKFWKDLKSGRFVSMVRESSKGEALLNSRDVFNVMRPMVVEHDDVECLYCIFLDSKNKILSIEKMFAGTITQANVYPREIVKKMLVLKAAALIMVHNHPSGCQNPSGADDRITKMVFVALHSIGAVLHEHIVIGETEFYSYADYGIIDKIRKDARPLFE